MRPSVTSVDTLAVERVTEAVVFREIEMLLYIGVFPWSRKQALDMSTATRNSRSQERYTVAASGGEAAEAEEGPPAPQFRQASARCTLSEAKDRIVFDIATFSVRGTAEALFNSNTVLYCMVLYVT